MANNNNPLTTDTARDVSSQNVNAYAAGVQDHLNGDWGGHNHVRVIDELFTDSNGDTIPNSKKLRMRLRTANSEITVVVPIVPLSTGESGDAPSFLLQPQSQEAVVGSVVTFTSSGTGALPISYQWNKGGVPITNAVSTKYTITNVQLANAGTYTIEASNANGITISNPAVLTVTES